MILIRNNQNYSVLKKYIVKVKAKAKNDEIVSSDVEGVDYEIKTKACPEIGKANKAVIKLLSKHLSIKQNNCKIIKGEKNRIKTILVEDPI